MACDTPDGGIRVETRAEGAMAGAGEGELPEASLDGDDTMPKLWEVRSGTVVGAEDVAGQSQALPRRIRT